MNLVQVISCNAHECAFNTEDHCHALAINVGEADNPQCDTYTAEQPKGGLPEVNSTVGACKVAHCKHNEDLLCTAPGIRVGHVENEVDCLTFEPR